MIGSPDLVAFTKETDFREIPPDPSALPEELSVSLYPYTGDTTPWSKTSSATFKKDFILLSEFSEQVGPQPLFTVPSETKACGTFDLNHFSLRIMSVDYQTSLAGSGGCSSLKLNFVEDSKVVLGDSREGAFAYVHHLTLYDLEARGFVRPLCLAYVSSNENKIIQQFLELSAEFSKVSECLKTGNRKNFANELETKLRDLEYTRVMLLKEIERERLNNSSINEREHTLNGVTTLERDTDEKQSAEPLSRRGAVKLKEKDRCEVFREEKVEFKNCTLELLEGENRSVLLNSEADGTKYERNTDFEENNERRENRYWSVRMASKAEELASVEKSIQEHKSLLKQVTSYPTRKLRESEFSPYEPDDISHSLELDLGDSKLHGQLAEPVIECSDFPCTNTPLHSPKLISSALCRRFDKRMKTLEELCDEYFHQQAMQQLHSIEKTFRGDTSQLYTHRLCQNLLRNLKSTNFLFEDQMYDLEEVMGLRGRTGGHQPIRQPCFLPAPIIYSEPVSLESYTSCVEMVPIKLGLGGSSHSTAVPSSVNIPTNDNLPPTPDSTVEADIEDEGEVSALDCDCNCQDKEYVSGIMKSSISSGDSIEVLGTEKSFRSHGLNTPMETALQKPPVLSTTAVLEGLRRRVPTRRANSEDSIEVLSTTDSIIPEDLRASYPCAIDEETPEQERDETDLSQNQANEQGKECVCGVGNGENGGVLMEEHLQDFHPTLTLTPPGCPVTLTLSRSNSHDVCHATDFIPFSMWEEPCRTVRDDLSDCFSFRSTTTSTASDCTFTAHLHGDKKGGGTRRRHGRAGRAALQFLRQFPFALHAVFSLMSGRTLVVLGSEETTVRRLVTALSIYTPRLGRYRENVQPWVSMPLQLTDLLNWKLIGFNRKCSLTPNMPHCLGHYSRYLSVLDVDQKTLRCPTYSGTLINQLVEPRSHITHGNTYFLFAHSILSKFVSRAFLITFSHGLHTPRSPRECVRAECFLSGLHRDDKKILYYLAELIKMSFIDSSANVLRFSYTTNSVFKL